MKPKLSPFAALKISTYRNYLLGAFISEIGNQMQTVAVAWQIYEMTRNPASLGLIGVANIVPVILLSLLGGLVADKLDRKKVLVISLVAQSLLALILFLLNTSHQINPIFIYLILFLVAAAQSFSIPVRQTIVPNLVPKTYFMNAVSLGTLQWQTAFMVGPAIAGFLIGFMGVPIIYLINCISFAFFIMAVLSIKTNLQKYQTKDIEFNLSSVWEGIKFVIKTPILYSTMILDFVATFFGEASILMPVFAKDVLHVGPQGLGFLYSAPAIGGVLAGLLIASLHHKLEHQGQAIIGSVVLYGIFTIAFGFSKVLPLSLLFLVGVGFGDMVSTILRNTIRQVITPDHLRGRMSSIMRIFVQGGPQLGEIEAGFLARFIGGPATVVLGGIGVIVITILLGINNKSLRQYQGKELVV